MQSRYSLDEHCQNKHEVRSTSRQVSLTLERHQRIYLGAILADFIEKSRPGIIKKLSNRPPCQPTVSFLPCGLTLSRAGSCLCSLYSILLSLRGTQSRHGC